MTNHDPTSARNAPQNPQEKPLNAPPLPPPKVVDEAAFVRQLEAAKGATVFSETPIQGDRPSLDFGPAHLGPMAYKDGAFVFSFWKSIEDQYETFFTEYLANQVRSILALRMTLGDFQKDIQDHIKGITLCEGNLSLEDLIPSLDPGQEGYNVFAEWADEKNERINIQMRRENDVIRFQLSPQDALAWALETGKLYASLTPDQRDARVVKLEGFGRAQQSPIDRMKAEGAGPYTPDAEVNL